jgi:hypothetical protein
MFHPVILNLFQDLRTNCTIQLVLSVAAYRYAHCRHPCEARIHRRRRKLSCYVDWYANSNVECPTPRHGGLDPPSPTPPRGNVCYCDDWSCYYRAVNLFLVLIFINCGIVVTATVFTVFMIG